MTAKRKPELTADQAAEELLYERINDLNGYLKESFSEANKTNLQELADAIIKGDNKLVGDLVNDMVYRYCVPDSDDIEQLINDRRDYT